MAFIHSLSARTLGFVAGPAVLATSLMVTRQEAHAESVPRDPRERLSIYPAPVEPVTLIEVTHPLSPHIAVAREATQDAVRTGRQAVERVVSSWVNFERKVEREVKSVLPRDEPLTPGILYVGVAGLAGSVFARNRNILLRFFLPPTLLILSAPYFLPKTSANVSAYLSKAEDTYAPNFAAKHDKFNDQLSLHLQLARDKLEGASDAVTGWGGEAVQKVEGATGLKLGDALKKAEEVKRQVEMNAERHKAEIQAKAEKPVETVGVVVEQIPVARIVKPVEDKTELAPGKVEAPALPKIVKPNEGQKPGPRLV